MHNHMWRRRWPKIVPMTMDLEGRVYWGGIAMPSFWVWVGCAEEGGREGGGREGEGRGKKVRGRRDGWGWVHMREGREKGGGRKADVVVDGITGRGG
ncbi:hypothetical protein D8674_008020 [Pyrus ussuriensis x Pyrus communis]|uniref:Uncharacterized protein n=1 Tax=Pyrus ussuriensis x Pyrus communis TaxID=2448454 RepID=A0A5N5HWA8_9ROSA|nr:hypothetical protein D8674_008020 [Pyrus ussuriensis x Pyrus communis]